MKSCVEKEGRERESKLLTSESSPQERSEDGRNSAPQQQLEELRVLLGTTETRS
jgi:hypothetical protein